MEYGKGLDLMCKGIKCQEMFWRQDDIPIYCPNFSCIMEREKQGGKGDVEDED